MREPPVSKRTDTRVPDTTLVGCHRRHLDRRHRAERARHQCLRVGLPGPRASAAVRALHGLYPVRHAASQLGAAGCDPDAEDTVAYTHRSLVADLAFGGSFFFTRRPTATRGPALLSSRPRFLPCLRNGYSLLPLSCFVIWTC